MPKTIELKYSSTCSDCGAALAVGAPAKYYGRGKVYGTECHPRPASGKGSYKPRNNGTNGEPPFENEFKAQNGRCEDAPCCGCCGPQGDGDYYGTSAAEHASEPRDY